MVTTVSVADRQLQATPGNHWQSVLPSGQTTQVGARWSQPEPEGVHMLDATTLQSCSFNSTLVVAAQHSGYDDYEIAEAMAICPGYMSRWMRGCAMQAARRLLAFQKKTKTLGPLQWLAHQSGCDLLPRDPRAAEVAELQQRLRELQQGQRFVA